MHTPTIKPFLWLAALVAAIGLACGLGADPTAVPSPTPAPSATPQPPSATPAPTATPPPTNTPQPTNTSAAPTATATTGGLQVNPTDTPAASNDPPAFYVEEFEGDISNYSYFVFNGVDGGADMVFTEDGALAFHIADRQTWVYVTYDPWSYGDVRIGLSAENKGVNSQRVSLLCRFTEDGWFEFNIGGDGLWEVWVYDSFADEFFLVGNGGSTDINLGKDTNIYVAECIGDSLRLYINGILARELAIPSDYRSMDEGAVGFAVSSFEAIPVQIDIDWFGIEEP